MRPVLLVNTNEMKPPIAPLGLDYLGGELARSGYPVEVVDLSFSDAPVNRLRKQLRRTEPLAVGVSFRNSDDCFWPSGTSFVPRLQELIEVIRAETAGPVVLGGSGFSVFPESILQRCGADFGIRGGGEVPFVRFLDCLNRGGEFTDVPGLVWRKDGIWQRNPVHACWTLDLPGARDLLENNRYFREGGQLGLESKRGCNRHCTYCADPLTKGCRISLRPPAEVADEAELLARRGMDVLHLCDSEFNIPLEHALAVCREFERRKLGGKLRWYAYVSPVPFTQELAHAVRAAGCAGLNFGADSADPGMLAAYGRDHRKEDIAEAAAACRKAGIKVMVDLLLGGPGETKRTVSETIGFIKKINPYCAGAALGVRLYPATKLTSSLTRSGPLQENPNVRWRGGSPSQSRPSSVPGGELMTPAFYISAELGEEPALLIRNMIGEDRRFFPPSVEKSGEDHNYNENEALAQAIREGARGAYWDILRQMK